MTASLADRPAAQLPSTDWDPLWANPSRPATAVVHPCTRLSGSIQAQPSKNYTTRQLLAAGLSNGERTVDGLATSDDAAAMVRVLKSMGATVTIETDTDPLGRPLRRRARIRGFGGKPILSGPARETGTIDVGNAGAVLRLALGIGSLLPQVTFSTTHTDSLGKRPNSEILQALQSLGIHVQSGPDGRLPITLTNAGTPRNQSPIRLQVSGARSSQFLSGLLFLAPHLGDVVHIEVTGGTLVSQPAIHQTVEVLRANGITVNATQDLLHFEVLPGEFTGPETTSINGDWPGSAAILAAGAIIPGEIQVHGLRNDSQGERFSQQVLHAYGAGVQPLMTYRPAFAQNGLQVLGGSPLNALEFDGDPLTDAVLAMLAPACFAHGTTRIHNVHNLRIKECDRISEPLAELRKLGVTCHEGHEVGDTDPDAIHITGSPAGYEGGIEVDGRGDHRVIMLLAVIGMRTRRGLVIRGAHHVAKSYPGFFSDLSSLGARVYLLPGDDTSSDPLSLLREKS